MFSAESSKTSNRVLEEGHRSSGNFFQSDLILREFLTNTVDYAAKEHLWPLLNSLGEQAAKWMDDLSLAADKNVPTLLKRDKWDSQSTKSVSIRHTGASCRLR